MPAAVVPAIIMAGSSIASSAIQAKAAGKATKQLQGGAQNVVDRVGPMYDPYRSVGTAAINSVGDMMGLSFDHIGFTPSGEAGGQSGGRAVSRAAAEPQGMAASLFQSGGNRRTPQANAWGGTEGQTGSIGDMGTYEPSAGDQEEPARSRSRSSYSLNVPRSEPGPLGGVMYDQNGTAVGMY